MASQMPDLTSSAAFRSAGAAAFASAGLTPADIDHAMLYDATAHLPLLALEDLGFVPHGESPGFGGLNYTHTGMYGMYALLESVRQLRGEAHAQVDGVQVSLTHAIGGMFQSAATTILTNAAG